MGIRSLQDLIPSALGMNLSVLRACLTVGGKHDGEGGPAKKRPLRHLLGALLRPRLYENRAAMAITPGSPPAGSLRMRRRHWAHRDVARRSGVSAMRFMQTATGGASGDPGDQAEGALTDGNRYSVEPDADNRILSLVANDAQVRLLDGDRVVGAHARSWARHQVVEAPEHARRCCEEGRRSRC